MCAAVAPEKVSDARRKIIASLCGKGIMTFALAAIAQRQDESFAHEEEFPFNNDGVTPPVRPWQSFENLIVPNPTKCTKPPITISLGAKMALANMAIAIADKVCECKCPNELLSGLGSDPVHLMMAVTARADHLLQHEPVSRDLDFPAKLCKMFEQLKVSKELSGAVSRRFLDFIKIIAWNASVYAYEAERLTLNISMLLGIIASFGSHLPGPTALNVARLMRNSVHAWEQSRVEAKAALLRATEPAAAVMPVAAPATVPVVAPATVPVAAPVTVPVAAPATVPVVAPATVPVVAPVTVPVSVPVVVPAPVAAPVVTPAPAPVAAPVTTPAPVSVPVPAPVSVPAPVVTPVTVAAVLDYDDQLLNELYNPTW